MHPQSNPPPAGPVLAVCGWSGSGKTTLLERVIPALRGRGLAVAVVKHDAHGLEVDHAGKDSDRLFRAGADVVLRGPDEALRRVHGADAGGLATALAALLADHDLVLVEGHKGTPLPKVWLASRGDPAPPPELTGVLAVLPWDGDRPAALLELLDRVLPEAWRAVPVLAGVLIGGAGSRMGSPKQLLTLGGVGFLRRVITALAPAIERVALLGEGPLPEECRELPRLADPPGLAGPLAGILAALRWAPANAWLFVACDLPLVTTAAVRWLLDQRAPGRWAVLPRDPAGVEPLFALYEPQARGPLEALAAAGERAPRLLAAHPKALSLTPPAELRAAWRNVNTPEELALLERELARSAAHRAS